MDFALNEEQQMLYESAQRFFVDNHPTARARKALPLSDAAQQKLWSDMAGMGWMSLLAPESMDGLGLGITEAYLVAEAGGRQLLNLPWASSAVLLPLWVQSLEKNAPEALLTLLSGILSGERVVHCVDERDPTRDFASQCTDLLVVRGLHDARQLVDEESEMLEKLLVVAAVAHVARAVEQRQPDHGHRAGHTVLLLHRLQLPRLLCPS